MAVLIEDNNSLWMLESLCWTCTEAYGDKCIFHDRINNYTWEEKLKIPSKVAIKKYNSSSLKTGTEEEEGRYVTCYKVLECPGYRSSSRNLNEHLKKQAQLLEQPIKKQSKKQKGRPVPSKTKAVNPVPSIDTKTSNLSYCIICGAPAMDKPYCSSLCRAMGSGLSIGGKRK